MEKRMLVLELYGFSDMWQVKFSDFTENLLKLAKNLLHPK